MKTLMACGKLPSIIRVDEDGRFHITKKTITVKQAEEVVNAVVSDFIDSASEQIQESLAEMEKHSRLYYRLHFFSLFLAVLFFVLWLFK